MCENSVEREGPCEHTYCRDGRCYLRWTHDYNLNALPGLVKEKRFDGCPDLAKYLAIVIKMQEKQIIFRIISPF